MTTTTAMRATMARRSRRATRPTPHALPPDASPTAGDEAPGASRRTLALRLPVDELSRYAGLTAFVTAVLGGAGIISTIAYLAAWEVPAPVLRLDPLTAALRSEIVLYQLALTGVILFGLASISRRLERRRWVGRAALGLAVACIGFLGVDALNGGFVGPVLTMSGGVLLFVAHRRAWVADRTIAVLLVVIALASAAQTGYEMGVGYRDGRTPRTAVSLTTTAPIGGLPGTAIDGAAWRYEDLYLVFRDGESVFVSTAGAGPRVWVVPAMRVAAVELDGKEP